MVKRTIKVDGERYIIVSEDGEEIISFPTLWEAEIMLGEICNPEGDMPKGYTDGGEYGEP